MAKQFLNGREVDFDACVNLMDDQIREALSCLDLSEPDFLEAYVAAHATKYDGEEFTI